MRTVNLDHVRTSQGDEDTSLIVPGQSNGIDFERRVVIDPAKIDMAFDKRSGILSIVTGYGIFQASGFLTSDSLGTGLAGKKGRRGLRGKPGKNGREGREGKVGCAGPEGNPGVIGEGGLDAEDGPQGPLGQIGCPGDVGPTGMMGALGATGPDGAQGARGISCLIGPPGDIGPTPNTTVVVSLTEPTNELVYLWAQPVEDQEAEAPVIPVDPGVIEPLSASLADRSLNLVRGTDGWFMAVAAFVPQNIVGGRGPFTYRWYGDFETQGDVSPFETGTAAQNINLRCRTAIAANSSVTVTGNIRLDITDTGNNNSVLSLSATYTFKGTNTSVTPNPGGGGGGCIVYGMQVLVSPNRAVNIEHVYAGDVLRGVDIAGLPDTSYGDNTAHLAWYTTDLDIADTDVVVNSSDRATYTSYYLLNEELKITLEETLLAKRLGVWSFIRVLDLKLGDMLYHIDGERELTSIQIVDQTVRTVSLNVETSDTYYVQGYLAHNRDGMGFEVKR